MTKVKLLIITLTGLFVSGVTNAENWQVLIDTKGASISLDADSINTYDGFVVGITKQELKGYDPKSYIPYVPFLYKCKSGETVALFRNHENNFELNGARIESPWLYSDNPVIKKAFGNALPKYCGLPKSKLEMELPLQLTGESLYTFFPRDFTARDTIVTTWIKKYSVESSEIVTSDGRKIYKTMLKSPEESRATKESINCETGVVQWHGMITKKNEKSSTLGPYGKEIIFPPGSAGHSNNYILCSIINK